MTESEPRARGAVERDMRNLLICLGLVCAAGLAAEPLRFELPACVDSARIVAQPPDTDIQGWVSKRAATLYPGESIYIELEYPGPQGVAALRPIAKAGRLAGVELQSSGVDPEMWRELATLPGLRELKLGSLGMGKVSDPAMVAGLADLERLTIGNAEPLLILQGAAKLPKLRHLDLPGSALASRDVREALVRLHGLTSLDVGLLEGVADAAACVAELPQLLELELWLADKGPDPSAFLDALAKRGQLRRLDIEVSHAAPEVVIKRIAAIRSLEELRLETDGGAGWTDALLASLAALPRLRSLHVLHEGPLTGAGMAAFAKAGCLEELCFWRESQIDDAGAAEIAKIRSLRKLCLTSKQIGTSGLLALSMLDLRELELSCYGVASPEGLRAFGRMKTLTSLNVSAFELDDSVAEAIGQLELLKSLSVFGRNLTSAGAAHFGALRGLRHLSCCSCAGVGDRALRAWAGLSLQGLELAYTGITDRGIPHIAAIRTLRHLDLALTGVTDAGLALLKNHPSLEKLDISSCTRVTIACADSLLALPRLKNVDARYCPKLDAEEFERRFKGRDATPYTDATPQINRRLREPDELKQPPPEPPKPADPPDNDLN